MPNKRLLFISTGILLITTLIVGMFGVVPLPEYDSITEDYNFEGKVIYHVEVQTKNIIPPAPDILDSCILYVDLSEKPIEEKKIICNSDLYDYSYDIYFYDAEIHQNRVTFDKAKQAFSSLERTDEINEISSYYEAYRNNDSCSLFWFKLAREHVLVERGITFSKYINKSSNPLTGTRNVNLDYHLPPL